MIEIYGLFDPDDNLRYIGKARDSQKRLKSHTRDCRRRNTPVYCWIRSLLDQGFSPTIKLLKVVDEAEWTHSERELIFFHRAAGTRLLNLADGGDEPYCTPEIRAANGRKTAAAIHSDPKRKRLWHLKQRLSHALSQGHCSESTREKMRECARKRPDLFGCWANI